MIETKKKTMQKIINMEYYKYNAKIYDENETKMQIEEYIKNNVITYLEPVDRNF